MTGEYDPKDRPYPPDPGDDPRARPPRLPPREKIDPCRVRPATPYLVIRSWPSDLGLRPVALQDAAAVSFSPDVEITRRIEPQPVGPVNVLSAWITNLGLATAAPVQVEFFLGGASVTFPPAELNHYATEYVIVPGHSSVRVDAPAFGGLIAVGYGANFLVRCSTPLDPRGPTVDPRLERHVGLLRFGDDGEPPDDPAPPVDFQLNNWLTAPLESRVEVAIERLRVASPAGDPESARRVRDALVRHADPNPDPDPLVQLARLEEAGRVRPRTARSVRRARREVCRSASDPLVRRSGLSSAAGSVAIETSLGEATRLQPDAGGLGGPCWGDAASAEALAGLPPERPTLVDGCRLEPRMSRTLTVDVRLREELRDDEAVVVHLFHVGVVPQAFLGRQAMVLRQPKRSKNKYSPE